MSPEKTEILSPSEGMPCETQQQKQTSRLIKKHSLKKIHATCVKNPPKHILRNITWEQTKKTRFQNPTQFEEETPALGGSNSKTSLFRHSKQHGFCYGCGSPLIGWFSLLCVEPAWFAEDICLDQLEACFAKLAITVAWLKSFFLVSEQTGGFVLFLKGS